MKRKIITSILFLSMLSMSIIGCGSSSEKESMPENVSENENESESGTVDLRIWIDEENIAVTQKMVDSFCQEYSGQAEFHITIEPVEAGNIKGDILEDVLSAGDLFSFPDDQLSMLIASGVVEPIADQEKVKSENLAEAIYAASYQDTVYAYPYTADNGYFLYYNKKYLSENDVMTFDGLLKAAEAADKKVSMEFDSGWYMYSFFGNTGLEVGINEDGVTNHCNWNATDTPIKGVDVAKAMQAILASPAFVPQPDSGFIEGIKDDSVIAGISGTWNAMTVKEVWGPDYGAIKLPTYTVAGQQVQMASFTGYRMLGVNHYSKHLDWAMKLGDWLTNEENQTLRFVERNQGPSNIKATASDEVSKVPAIQAIIDQSQFGNLQRIGGKYWSPCTNFAQILIQGNPNNIPLQDLMDELVNSITASAAN